jgi:FMN-dependent NADH-azoreductase
VKLLDIQSSPRGQSSDSITLTKSFIEACKSNDTSIVVDTLNVWHERLRFRRLRITQVGNLMVRLDTWNR